MGEIKGRRRPSSRSPEPAIVSRQQNILLTWVGSHDPTGWNPRTKSTELGPILSLLQQREFDAVYLFINVFSGYDDFRKRATEVLLVCRRDRPRMRVSQKPLDIIYFPMIDDLPSDLVNAQSHRACFLRKLGGLPPPDAARRALRGHPVRWPAQIRAGLRP